jgi:hypothetical protein
MRISVSPCVMLAMVFLGANINSALCRAADATITLQIKVFNSNKADEQVVPTEAEIYVRKAGSVTSDFYDRMSLGMKDAKEFYPIQLPKGVFIERIAILTERGGVVFNTATITHVVTADNMVMYPGASNPLEKFNFSAYVSQLGTYRDMFTELVDQYGEAQRGAIRAFLEPKVGKQVKQMAAAISEGRLALDKDEKAAAGQRAGAQKLADDVVELYYPGTKKPPQEPTLVVECPPSCPQYIECQPTQRCWILGRRRFR